MDLWYIHQCLRHNSLPSTLTDRHTHSLRHTCLPRDRTRTPYCSCCRSQEVHNLFNTYPVKTNPFVLQTLSYTICSFYISYSYFLFFILLLTHVCLRCNFLISQFQTITTSLQRVPILKPIFRNIIKMEYLLSFQFSDNLQYMGGRDSNIWSDQQDTLQPTLNL